MPKNHVKRPFLGDKNLETKVRFRCRIYLCNFQGQLKIEIDFSDIHLQENNNKLTSD